jgi:hypothetical protein
MVIPAVCKLKKVNEGSQMRIKAVNVERVVLVRRQDERQGPKTDSSRPVITPNGNTEGDSQTKGSRTRWMFYSIPVAVAIVSLVSGVYHKPDRNESGMITTPVPGPPPETRTRNVTVPVPALKPTLWVLSIGVSRYQKRNLDLDFADHDAEQIAAFLKTQKGALFKAVNVTLLTNEDVDRNSILSAVKNIYERCLSYDVAFIFVSGHGILDADLNTYYFLPHPADPDSLLTEGLRWSDFSDAMKKLSIRIKKVLLALDTCHAGAGASSRAALASKLELDSGYILSASKPEEPSVEGGDFRFEGERKGHGAFTFALLKGLKGLADTNRDGTIKIDELFEYISGEVPKLTDYKQHPYRISVGSEIISIASVN